jgi:hypothetical protein
MVLNSLIRRGVLVLSADPANSDLLWEFDPSAVPELSVILSGGGSGGVAELKLVAHRTVQRWLYGQEPPRSLDGNEGDFFFQAGGGLVWVKESPFFGCPPRWKAIAKLPSAGPKGTPGEKGERGLQGSPGKDAVFSESSIAFLDNFADGSIFWAWRQDGVAAGKTITESGSTLTIAVSAGTGAVWNTASKTCPSLTIGVPGAPCEIICKLNSFTPNDNTDAGIFLSISPVAGAASSTWGFYRHRNDGAGENGYLLNIFGVAAAYSDSVTTMPVWLRIRMNAHATNGKQIIWGYSFDGNSYTDVYTDTGTTPAYDGGITVGMFARNFTTTNAVSAPFDSFQMKRSIGPG